MGATAWVLDPAWAPSVLMPTPVMTNDLRYAADRSRHLMRYVYAVNRNAILQDFIRKLATRSA